MPNQRISDLSSVVSLSGGDLIPIVSGGTTKKATAANFLSYILPSGIILMWSGTIVSIPSGWAICDGLNGTPNLKDKFLVGAGTTYGVGDTGGEATHVLTVPEMPSHTHVQDAHTHTQNAHTHTIQGQGSATPATSGTHIVNSTATGGSSRTMASPDGANSTTATNQNTTATNQSTGGGGAHNNLPPYYALAYIMKL